ncbi:MAG TPA: holdfast anchoring protein HfaA [Rhizomicrobium sp.]|jgi:holdfast attachment protein HfaA
MSNAKSLLLSTALAGAFLVAGVTAAAADDYSNAGSYNHGYGMSSGQENSAVDPSLRDANGNLSVVNGVFTSSTFGQQSGIGQLSASGQQLSTLGNSSTGAGSGGATAIGNALNVVTVGNNNTVVVNSTQTNTGTVTATVNGSTSNGVN